MYKKLFVVILPLLLLFSSCEEDPISTRNTAPRIGFAFFVDGKARMPDSVITSGGKHIFEDSLAAYSISLPVDLEAADYQFYVDTLTSNVSVFYSLELVNDVDRIMYKGFNPSAMATNVDSLTILCTDILTCTTDEAIINLYF